nr:hypothetical protein [Aquabacterium terrae]
MNRAGVTQLTDIFTANLSPGGIAKDDPAPRQQAALAGVKVWEKEFVGGQILADTLIYDFSGGGTVRGTGQTTDNAGNVHKGADFIVSANGNVEAGEGDDYVFGGSGANRIDGGKGNDFLDGGNGADTYVFSTGWGVDTVRDGDGVGQFEVAGFQGGLPIGRKAPGLGGVWKSDDGSVRYQLIREGTSDTLVITFSGANKGNSIIVKNWSPTTTASSSQQLQLDATAQGVLETTNSRATTTSVSCSFRRSSTPTRTRPSPITSCFRRTTATTSSMVAMATISSTAMEATTSCSVATAGITCSVTLRSGSRFETALSDRWRG